MRIILGCLLGVLIALVGCAIFYWGLAWYFDPFRNPVPWAGLLMLCGVLVALGGMGYTCLLLTARFFDSD